MCHGFCRVCIFFHILFFTILYLFYLSEINIIHLLVQGAIISVIQYFRSCAMPCLQSVGISSSLPLCLHLFFGRSDFAQMWLCSRLKQSPNHFSLLFSMKVSTGFTSASFLMSSLLMWSNLVLPLAHLNILHDFLKTLETIPTFHQGDQSWTKPF